VQSHYGVEALTKLLWCRADDVCSLHVLLPISIIIARQLNHLEPQLAKPGLPVCLTLLHQGFDGACKQQEGSSHGLVNACKPLSST